jgi:hypothetical protein
MNHVKSRFVFLLAIPFVVATLLVTGAGPASASAPTSTLIYHSTRHLHLPAASGVNADVAAAYGQNCVWDTYIYRTDSAGHIAGQTAVLCDGPMVLIRLQAQLLINEGARPETDAQAVYYPADNFEQVQTTSFDCLSGVNRTYGAVLVQNPYGVATDFGESAVTIACK